MAIRCCLANFWNFPARLIVIQTIPDLNCAHAKSSVTFLAHRKKLYAMTNRGGDGSFSITAIAIVLPWPLFRFTIVFFFLLGTKIAGRLLQYRRRFLYGDKWNLIALIHGMMYYLYIAAKILAQFVASGNFSFHEQYFSNAKCTINDKNAL